MLKQTARFTALALVMFAAIASPLTANAISQFDGPEPYPLPPNSCMPMPCLVGLAR
jgi:hypothetical protein